MSALASLLANPPASLELRFRTGHRKAESGEVLLSLFGDGRARIEHRQGETKAQSMASLSVPETQALFAALASAGFPDAPSQTVPPGAGIIAIELIGGPAHEPVLLHRSFLRDFPAWLACVQRLDAACEVVRGH